MFDRKKFALHGAPQRLPRPASTAAAIYSVPRPSGGYDYYRAPAGSAPPQNDDFPIPTVAHPNAIGVSSLTMGRPLPPGSVPIGSGDEARGSITPMPGVTADGPLTSGLGASSFGAASFGDFSGLANAFGTVVETIAPTTPPATGSAAKTMLGVCVVAGLVTAAVVYQQRQKD